MQILCGQCGRTIQANDAQAGSTVRCPHCGRGIRLPAADQQAAQPEEGLLTPLEADEDLADEFLTKARLALKKKLLVVCGSCGERLTVEQRLAGKVARCPACGGPIRIPAQPEEKFIEPEEVLTDAPSGRDALDIAGGPGAAERAGGVPHGRPPAEGRPAARTAIPVELAQAAADYRPPARLSKPHPGRMLLVLGAVALAAAIGGVTAGYLLWGPPASQPPPMVEEPPEQSSPPPPARAPAVRPGPVTSTRPATGPAAPVMPTPPPAAEVSVTGASWSVLAGDGLVPAPLGEAFLLLSLQVTAGEEPLRLDVAPGTVALEAAGRRIPALGVPAGESSLPLPGRPAVISVPAGATRQVTLVFLAAEDLNEATLKVTGAGDLPLPPLPRPRPLAPETLAGTYQEAGRYLRLSFPDPLMEQVRSAGPGRLVIRPQAGGFQVVLSPPGLRGQARAEAGGAFLVRLTDGARALPCHLRLADGGAKLILYLAGAPFHQIIYDRQ
jgi:hypothetical protein